MACCHNIKFCLVNHLDSHQLSSVDLTSQFDHSVVAPAQCPTQMVQSTEVRATGAAPELEFSTMDCDYVSRGVHV